jgi:hypothetical protein
MLYHAIYFPLHHLPPKDICGKTLEMRWSLGTRIGSNPLHATSLATYAAIGVLLVTDYFLPPSAATLEDNGEEEECFTSNASFRIGPGMR